ncbi:NAD(P)-dependent oxidoreductase [Caulobacter sp. Root343]|uniref:NAD-dependent epimerase/dehydratase family protein n=1 Tax=Caulobacter sp. Root343 TaxID=1736520 RepID=UPI0006FD931B|nr:NAD-dependent epimerase/dehydratase family protein [Caulobacter sp. Root343]KQV64107.1 epimerase [Caulobacter sp. Root343]
MGGSRKVVFLTGATGAMGREAVKAIAAKRQDLDLRVLVRPEEKSHPVVRDIQRRGLATIFWGDLTDAASVRAGVAGADVVLHMGALVSPLADRLPPDVVHRVNVGGTQNVVDAIHADGGAQRTRLIYIGTVAETGSRNAPVHWGRTGDPIKLTAFCHYAVSKTLGEAIVAESGLKYWASLRQSGMAHYEMWKIFDPIMFHNPLNGVFEWSTAHDSGRLMAAVCGDDVPAEFWRGFYNIGGGAASRVVNHQFMARTMPQYQSILQPHWFATRNFHGQWYADSDKLEALVPFRQQSLDDYFKAAPKHTPWVVRQFPKLFPGAVRKRIETLAKAPGGSLHWFEANETDKIRAYFGSREAWEAIPRDWDKFEFAKPSNAPTLLDHGYDETRAIEDLRLDDLRQAAEFRGGACLAQAYDGPDQAVSWRASDGQIFERTPRLYLKGGHWGPVRVGDTDADSQEAKRNPFFAQVWSDLRG